LVNRIKYRAIAESRNVASRRVQQPSFTYKFHEYARIRSVLKRNGHKEPVFTVNAKDAAHAWARRLGVRTPELVGVFDDAAEIPWASLPDRVVLKPTRGTTSTGVYLLERTTSGWEDLYRNRSTTSEALTHELHALAHSGAISRSMLVEQLILDPRFPKQPPIDYKVHTFYGTVGLIECKSHGVDGDGNPVGFFYGFDPDWRPIGGGNPFHEASVDPLIPPPVHPDELLAVARKVSASVPRPYLRVDLFEDESGPVFGELTPEPGGALFLRGDLDRHLGELWEDAEARLRIRAVTGGWLDPDDGPQPEAFLDLSWSDPHG
jgi:hypothetical protein